MSNNHSMLYAAPIGPPTALRAVSVNLSAITISWDPVNCIQQNSIIKNYTIHYRKSSEYNNISSKLISVSAAVTDTTIYKLDPNTEYAFRVEAINENGLNSPPTKLNVNTSVPNGKLSTFA